MCYRSAEAAEPSKTAFLRRRPAANHIDNHPKPLLDRRGFCETLCGRSDRKAWLFCCGYVRVMESAKGRVCCRSARVTALPVTVFLRSGRIGWFIGESDFFCTHCDRLSSFVVSPFAGFYRICGFSVGRGPFRCCGRIYSFGQRILIFVRCQYWFSSKNLRNLFCNTPWWYDVLQNIFYLCRVVAYDMTYFDESVSLLSLTGNLAKFEINKSFTHTIYS